MGAMKNLALEIEEGNAHLDDEYFFNQFVQDASTAKQVEDHEDFVEQAKQSGIPLFHI